MSASPSLGESVLPPAATRLAAGNHGVVDRPQLRAAGLSAKREHRLREHRLLLPVLGHTFVEAGQHIGIWQRAAASHLLTGGVASHSTAAELHALPARRDPRTHCIVLPQSHHRVAGLITHRVPLTDDEIEILDGILATSKARTVVDLLATLTTGPAVDLAREAVHRRWITLDGLAGEVARRRGWQGTPKLKRLLRLLTDGGRSEAERLLHDILKRNGVSGWLANVDLDGIGEVDVLFPRLRLIVEVDGFAVHNQRQAFNYDRRKGRAMTIAGYTVLRFTWEDLTRRPGSVASEILVTLGKLAGRPG